MGAVLACGGKRPVQGPAPVAPLPTAGLAGGGGGRYALVPAALVYRRPGAPEKASGDVGAQHAAPLDSATAELSMAMVDVRLGRIEWRTVARGDGDDPWSSLGRAMKSVTPGLP